MGLRMTNSDGFTEGFMMGFLVNEEDFVWNSERVVLWLNR